MITHLYALGLLLAVFFCFFLFIVIAESPNVAFGVSIFILGCIAYSICYAVVDYWRN